MYESIREGSQNGFIFHTNICQYTHTYIYAKILIDINTYIQIYVYAGIRESGQNEFITHIYICK